MLFRSIILLLTIACSAFAASLEDYSAKFAKHLADIDAKHMEATKTNLGKYRIALTTMRERAREAGQLNAVLLIDTASEDAMNAGRVPDEPPGNAFAMLEALHTSYLEKQQAVSEDSHKTVLALFREYSRVLDDLKADFTRQNQIDAAIEVKGSLDDLKVHAALTKYQPAVDHGDAVVEPAPDPGAPINPGLEPTYENLIAVLAEHNPEFVDQGQVRGKVRNGSFGMVFFGRAKITTLKGIAQFPIEELHVPPGVTDLSPLRGMPVQALRLGSGTSDLSILKTLPKLERLDLSAATDVQDLKFLEGLRIKSLTLPSRLVVSLRSVRLPLQRLNVRNGELGLDEMRAIASLRLTELDLSRSDVSDLRFLTRMPLERLRLNECEKLVDVSPLTALAPAGKLKWVELRGTGIDDADLHSLVRLPLEYLDVSKTKVTKGELLKDRIKRVRF